MHAILLTTLLTLPAPLTSAKCDCWPLRCPCEAATCPCLLDPSKVCNPFCDCRLAVQLVQAVEPKDEPKPHLPTPPCPNCQCGCTETGKCNCKDCDHPQLTKAKADAPKVAALAAPQGYRFERATHGGTLYRADGSVEVVFQYQREVEQKDIDEWFAKRGRASYAPAYQPFYAPFGGGCASGSCGGSSGAGRRR